VLGEGEGVDRLSAGMAVTTEIKTAERMVLDCLLAPLQKYKQEALRER
jgi:hypothetical protein